MRLAAAQLPACITGKCCELCCRVKGVPSAVPKPAVVASSEEMRMPYTRPSCTVAGNESTSECSRSGVTTDAAMLVERLVVAASSGRTSTRKAYLCEGRDGCLAIRDAQAATELTLPNIASHRASNAQLGRGSPLVGAWVHDGHGTKTAVHVVCTCT